MGGCLLTRNSLLDVPKSRNLNVPGKRRWVGLGLLNSITFAAQDGTVIFLRLKMMNYPDLALEQLLRLQEACGVGPFAAFAFPEGTGTPDVPGGGRSCCC